MEMHNKLSKDRITQINLEKKFQKFSQDKILE